MKHTWKITLMLLAIFIAAQLVGLFVITKYIDYAALKETGKTSYRGLPFDIQRPEVEESFSYIYIILAVIIGTLLLLLLIKFRKVGLWKIWFFVAIVATLTVSLAAFIQQYVALCLAIVIALWKILRPNIYIHNLSEILIYGGLAAIFTPIINIFSGIMLLIFISLYDMYAVWRSKHMVAMAKFQTESKLFAGLYLPYDRERQKDEKMEKRIIAEHRPSELVVKTQKTAILGGGDIGFPLIFTGVVMKSLINEGLTIGNAFMMSIIVIATTSLALFLLLWKSQKDTFYPAMPFLSAGCLLGYGIVWLL